MVNAMPYRVRLVEDEAELRQLEQAWTELLLHTPFTTVFASYQWNAAWWRHFGAEQRLHVLVVTNEASQTTAIAPLMVTSQGPLRKLEFIGNGLSDYGDFLVHPAAIHSSLQAIFAYLRTHNRRWDLADWSEVPPGSVLLSYLRTYRSGGLHAALIPQTPCSVIDLPATWEEYISSLPRKRRYYLNSFPRKFLSEHDGDLRMTTSGPEVAEVVDRFHGLHLARWHEKSEHLSEEHTDPAFAPFLQEVCGQFAERGWLQLASLHGGDQAVASSINFRLRDRWNSYMKGFDPTWSKARPGTVLDALRVKQAIALGARHFDFGRGDEPYKSGFGGVYRRNTRVLVATRSPRSVAAFVALLFRIRFRDFKSRTEQDTAPAENGPDEETG